MARSSQEIKEIKEKFLTDFEKKFGQKLSESRLKELTFELIKKRETFIFKQYLDHLPDNDLVMFSNCTLDTIPPLPRIKK